ncbi:DUF2199 domain-containing protein [Sphingomonas sp. ASV193]|uniref:DUF2199 domain-containing protein n=1 Tax=Sphingomonas sp. ASV193 TaxID=3144405 RepID=UPI0032E888D1
MIRRLFGKRTAALSPKGDPWAVELLRSDWRCGSCNERHRGLMDLAATSPDPWPHAAKYEPNAALRRDGDFLSEDFCVLEGKYFFIRSVLYIPIHGLNRSWGFGCWNTLSRTNFDRYVEGFDAGIFEDDGWSGWLCNHLKTFFEDGEPLAVDVFPQAQRQRPKLVVQDATHPLGEAQRDGISAELLLGLFRAYGHGPMVQ